MHPRIKIVASVQSEHVLISPRRIDPSNFYDPHLLDALSGSEHRERERKSNQKDRESEVVSRTKAVMLLMRGEVLQK